MTETVQIIDQRGLPSLYSGSLVGVSSDNGLVSPINLPLVAIWIHNSTPIHGDVHYTMPSLKQFYGKTIQVSKVLDTTASGHNLYLDLPAGYAYQNGSTSLQFPQAVCSFEIIFGSSVAGPPTVGILFGSVSAPTTGIQSVTSSGSAGNSLIDSAASTASAIVLNTINGGVGINLLNLPGEISIANAGVLGVSSDSGGYSLIDPASSSQAIKIKGIIAGTAITIADSGTDLTLNGITNPNSTLINYQVNDSVSGKDITTIESGDQSTFVDTRGNNVSISANSSTSGQGSVQIEANENLILTVGSGGLEIQNLDTTDTYKSILSYDSGAGGTLLVSATPLSSYLASSTPGPSGYTNNITALQYSNHAGTSSVVNVDSSQNINLNLKGGGNMSIIGLPSSTEPDVLYYNPLSGNVYYGAPSGGSGVATVTSSGGAGDSIIDSTSTATAIVLNTINAGNGLIVTPTAGVVTLSLSNYTTGVNYTQASVAPDVTQSIGLINIPANTITALGQKFRYENYGYFFPTGSDTMTFTVRFGGSVVAATDNLTGLVTDQNYYYRIDLDLLCTNIQVGGVTTMAFSLRIVYNYLGAYTPYNASGYLFFYSNTATTIDVLLANGSSQFTFQCSKLYLE